MNRNYLVPIALFVLSILVLAGCAQPPAATNTPVPAATAAHATATETTASATPTPAGAGEAASDLKSWPMAPHMFIDTSKIYIATLKTEKGDIVVELDAKNAPVTTNNFVFLANEGYYDNTTFHRVIPGFMAQGGDPTGTGTGSPGYTIPDEITQDMHFDRLGLMAMANAGPDTAGGQFFITYAPAPWLDGNFTIFGEVIDGMDVLSQLTPRDPEKAPDFEGDKLLTVKISEAETSKRPTPTPTPTPYAPDAKNDDHFMADMKPEDRIGYWNAAPESILEPGKIYVANIETDKGVIQVELMPDLAPHNVNNFIVLANNGYYDNTRFFQVIPDADNPDGGLIVAIGGDPADTGEGTPGYVLDDELSETAFADKGWFGIAQPGSNQNGGAFFITLKSSPWLSAHFTPLGRVVGGEDVLDKFQPLTPNDNPDEKGVLIKRVTITTPEVSLLPTPVPTPTPFAPTLPQGDARPLSKIPPAERNNYFNTPPAMQIDPAKSYQAIIHTEKGDITLDLFADQTPVTVNNFVVLARMGFYDDASFHRVVPDFVAQGGDPTGTGAGSPGYVFDDEIINDLRFDRAGLLAMANRGFNTNGAQFFITLAETPWLNDKHTIFGEVVSGMDVVQSLTEHDPQKDATPGDKIIRIDIVEK